MGYVGWWWEGQGKEWGGVKIGGGGGGRFGKVGKVEGGVLKNNSKAARLPGKVLWWGCPCLVPTNRKGRNIRKGEERKVTQRKGVLPPREGCRKEEKE